MYKDGADRKVRKAVEKDVVIDGTNSWSYVPTTTTGGCKRFLNSTISVLASIASVVTKHDGKILKPAAAGVNWDGDAASTNQAISLSLNVSAFNHDTGFAETYAPISDEVKAFFNGWKVKTANPTTNSPTAWVSVVNGADAPTQTLAYVSTTKAPNYTPYKLSYSLATPVIETVSEKVEGDISVNGLTQVEVGGGVISRETATPVVNLETTFINNIYPSLSSSKLSNRVGKLVAIYKDGVANTDWTILIGHPNGYGKVYASIPTNKYDATAKYTVTYIPYDKEKLTSAAVNVRAEFANNVRTALDDTVKKTEDLATNNSINSMLLYEVIKRLKAGGL